jgi:deoxyadenosine/deoxycytidine kinase
MRIGIVGPCAAGKTTLEGNLMRSGFEDVRAIVQEHSGVQSMWLQVSHPDILIYLDASIETINVRRQVKWEQAYLDEMNRRLAHARMHADFLLDTDTLSIVQVRDCVLEFLKTRISDL